MNKGALRYFSIFTYIYDDGSIKIGFVFVSFSEYFPFLPDNCVYGVANAGFDYEGSTLTFNLTFTLTDGTATVTSDPLTVNVINENEAPYFTSSQYSITTAEGNVRMHPHPDSMFLSLQVET